MSENNKTQVNKPAPRGGGPGGGPAGAMSRPAEKAQDFKGTLGKLIRYVKPHTFSLVVVFIFAILSTTFSIWSPKILGEATTMVFDGYIKMMMKVPGAGIDFTGIAQILIFVAMLYIGSALFSFVQQFVMAGISQKIVLQMRGDVNAKLIKLPLRFYDNHSHGDVLSRVTNDIDTISTTLQQSLTQLITAVVTIGGVLIMMLTINWQMTLIALLSLPVSAVVTMMIAKRSQKYFVGQQRSLGDVNGHVEEMYSGHNVIKAFGREDESVRVFEENNKELYGYGWKAQFMSGVIMPALKFVGNISYVLLAVVGSLFAISYGLPVGDIQAFLQYSQQFNQPIMQVANIANVIQSTVAAAERVFQLLEEQEEVAQAADSVVIEHPKGHVVFDHVKFGYNDDKILIHDMNIEAKPGQTIAIVGPTGAGKTTLVNLLMRFYELNAGHIYIDGVDITKMDRGHLRQMFGMVLQDTWLFNGTIRDNIAYGNQGAPDGQIIAAAQAASADHFIRTLPNGYDTIVNEDASNISQGQKQLLTIARAILANPEILILDEATSSVDTRTELLIQDAMSKLMEGRTSFVIAHRLSTIRNADMILVMNHGDIIEQGTHDQLLEANGFYADLYNSQFTTNSNADMDEEFETTPNTKPLTAY
ncbi:ABC transporter ATP-binding protein [Culicoidibacter larvae]|uniref:ABC transporter ATP-binding protein n=1 Tax=Culicoidibacter larvae TaxID=2579976 RepID=A0A5R8QEA9_9FIRM|nr:ABC transporter ATP-binding protein [Culicoidibacter larvae]TLG75360.1 ABC transporter ATP-binding protein [Culicoidibacter larvae]